MVSVVCCLGVVFFGEIGFQSQAHSVVDRPSLALVRQCRKKKVVWGLVCLVFHRP